MARNVEGDGKASVSVEIEDIEAGEMSLNECEGKLGSRIPGDTIAQLKSNIREEHLEEVVGDGDAVGMDIPEEEAVCRICMIELREGGESIKLECNCKGELALAHRECASKWFSIKGNRKCDICSREVQNLPLHIQTARNRMWRNIVPALVNVTVNVLCYLWFLEEFLVLGGHVAFALPFSCILGLLASLTSYTMAMGVYVWVYASFQFVLVVIFAYFFQAKFHMQASLSVFLSLFLGFGMTMSGRIMMVISGAA